MLHYRIPLNEQLSFSRIVHGHWRLADWKMTKDQISNLLDACLDLGITTIDTADIYGYHSCEGLFGEVLKNRSSLRQQLEIVTKCGIKLMGEKFPERKVKIYDYNYDYIIRMVEKSLKEMNIDYLDVVLLHRPSPLLHPDVIQEAFQYLHMSGKVRYFGVSNFYPSQFDALQANLTFKLVTNQVEISPLCLEHFDNGNMDYFIQHKIKPMSWSPLAGGAIFERKTERHSKVLEVLQELSETHSCNIDTIAYAWLLHHPADIIPIVGSQHIHRLQSAVDALHTNISDEEWFRIYIASRGQDLA